jgi:hypothetical protein
MEQAQYVEGVLWADKAHRMDMDPERNVSHEIDPYGTCSKHFWRGVLESAGYVALASGRPRLALAGSYSFLIKFCNFLKEEMESAGQGMAWQAADADLRFQAIDQKLAMNGRRAQEVCRVLYVGAEISLDSISHVVDEILAWGPKKHTEL